MKHNENDVKYQSVNLCNAMVRNMNDNFISVSFELKGNGDIQVLFILQNQTKNEEEYIDDIIAEFSALQETDCVLRPIIVVGETFSPLDNVVFKKGNRALLC